GCTVSEVMPNGLSSPASWLWVSGLPRVHSAHGRSGSATRAATRPADFISSLLAKAVRMSASSPTFTAESSCSPGSRQAASRARRGQSPPARSAIAISGPVVQRIRDGRFWVRELVEVVRRPSRRLPPQDRKLLRIALAQTLNRRGLRLPLQCDNDGAVLERVGQLADRGDGLRCPRRDPPR